MHPLKSIRSGLAKVFALARRFVAGEETQEPLTYTDPTEPTREHGVEPAPYNHDKKPPPRFRFGDEDADSHPSSGEPNP